MNQHRDIEKYVVLSLRDDSRSPLWYQTVKTFDELQKYVFNMLSVESTQTIVIHVVRGTAESD